MINVPYRGTLVIMQKKKNVCFQLNSYQHITIEGNRLVVKKKKMNICSQFYIFPYLIIFLAYDQNL
jgi:hypothetical protein